MGPTGFLGLNEALKQMLALKQKSLRPFITQFLVRMLILPGVNEALAVMTARPRVLKAKTTYVT